MKRIISDNKLLVHKKSNRVLCVDFSSYNKFFEFPYIYRYENGLIKFKHVGIDYYGKQIKPCCNKGLYFTTVSNDIPLGIYDVVEQTEDEVIFELSE